MKNPTQHYTDLLMLSQKRALQPVFCIPNTNVCKPIDCIRVDGATDEGPPHEIIQYWWTEWHIIQRKVATLVTTRSSGSSYLNRVELQNGCLSLGHSNTFIPSTLAGSCIDKETGNDKLKENLHLAMDAYISRVDGCPCGESVINLYKGCESQEYHSITPDLEVFLRGSKKQKSVLRAQKPSLYSHFQKVWKIRNEHMVQGLPPAYIFFLKCCYKVDCEHPVCISGPPSDPHCWYPSIVLYSFTYC